MHRYPDRETLFNGTSRRDSESFHLVNGGMGEHEMLIDPRDSNGSTEAPFCGDATAIRWER